MKQPVLIIFCLLFFYSQCWAGGAVSNPQKVKAQRKQMIEKERQIIYQQKMQEEQRKKSAEKIPVNEAEVQEIVELNQLLAAFATSSEAWPLIIDTSAKEMVMAHYIDQFRQQGITIQNPPALYVNAIDTMSESDREMLKQPFENILRVIAIIEYDFDNGQDKNKMALQILGEKGFQENKERLLQRPAL